MGNDVETRLLAQGFFPKFIVSLLLHVITLGCVACLWSKQYHPALPLFQAGEFCLDLAPAAVAPVALAVEPAPPVPVVEKVKEEPKEPEEVDVEQSEEDPDSDLQANIVSPPSPATAQAISAPDAPIAPSAGSLSAGTTMPGVPNASRLESYIRPIYPPGARMRGEEGAVTVRALVTSSGQAQSIAMVRSSGYPALDEAAVNAVRRARFLPARQGHLPVDSQTTLTFRFTLVD